MDSVFTSPTVLTPSTWVHGRKSDSNFMLPPLDASLTLPEIYDFHYKVNPNHPVFIYEKGHGIFKYLSFSDVVPAADRAARYVANIANDDLNADSSPVAILATSDTITYFTTVLGLLRRGVIVVPISPRNSSPAVAHLLHQTRASYVLISVEATICVLANDAIKQFKESYPHQRPPMVSIMPVFDDIYVMGDQHTPLRPQLHDWNRPRIIAHSSGSTSFPKPIVCNFRHLMYMMLAIHFGSHDLCGEIMGCQSMAMYHAFGLNFISWVASSGLIMATFEPGSPATIPTPDSTFIAFSKVPVSYIVTIPAFLEEWSRDTAKVKFMKTLKGVCFGGGTLNQIVGDTLAKEGVSIYSCYGLTETGIINLMFPDPPGMDWEYFAINPHCSAEFRPLGDATYELIVVKTPIQELPLLNTKLGGQDAYATSDVLAPHPTKLGQWKVIGRTDDQIMLNNGEKTNPGPLESILCQDRRVSKAIMFGRGRYQNGVIIEPRSEYTLEPSDEKKLADFRNDIWSAVQKMNAFAPTHSRLFKEMILVASPGKPFPLTTKGAPQRAVILRDYEAEIETLYSTLDKINLFNSPSDWSTSNSLSFVSLVVRNVLNRTIGEADNIFKFGCDSLQAMWIRNVIFSALRNTASDSVARISTNLVYEYPSIISLSQYVSIVAQAAPNAADKGTSPHSSEELEVLVTRYTSSFQEHAPRLPAAQKDVVLMTGTTGALGAAVLAKLVSSESVGKIFAYNRPRQGAIDILQKQKDALRIRGYDEGIAVSPKVVLLEGELTATGLGIDPALEEEIRNSITHIIHIGWRVDFNLRVSSFESAIGGIRTLVDFALSSPLSTPPRLVFASSVGVLKNIDLRLGVPFAEIPIDDPYVPLGQGYAESKWVAERILYTASKHTSLRPVVVRIGQISGGINGSWNPSEWVGAMVKSSLAMGCFPESKGTCSWIPLDVAACAMAEMRNTASSTVNLAHPHGVPFSDLFLGVIQTLSLPLVPYVEWEKKLEEVAATAFDASSSSSHSTELVKRIPAIVIIDFFKGASDVQASDDGEVMGVARLRVEAALDESVTLRNARPLGAEDALLWLKYWKEIGFLP